MFKLKLDTTNFMKAQKVFQRHSRVSPAQNLNRAVYFVVDYAQKITPSVSVSRIDSQLGVLTSPKIKRNGQLSTDKKGRGSKVNVLGHIKASGGWSVPLAALIVNARANPYSWYNRKTGQEWALPQSPFKGVSRRVGAARMTAAIRRMVKARHSSTHFFQHSWSAVKNALLPFMPAGYGRSAGPKVDPTLGTAIPAVEGSSITTCIIENRIGNSGQNAVLDAARNKAANRILSPVMQMAIDTEFNKALVRLDKKGWMDDAPELARYGFIVTV